MCKRTVALCKGPDGKSNKHEVKERIKPCWERNCQKKKTKYIDVTCKECVAKRATKSVAGGEEAEGEAGGTARAEGSEDQIRGGGGQFAFERKKKKVEAGDGNGNGNGNGVNGHQKHGEADGKGEAGKSEQT